LPSASGRLFSRIFGGLLSYFFLSAAVAKLCASMLEVFLFRWVAPSVSGGTMYPIRQLGQGQFSRFFGE